LNQGERIVEQLAVSLRRVWKNHFGEEGYEWKRKHKARFESVKITGKPGREEKNLGKKA